MKNNYSDLKGKTVLITGASRGIGFETVRHLLNNHAKVLSLSRTSVTLERNFAQEISTQQLIIKNCDLSNGADITRALQGIKCVDKLIHNAGFFQASLLEDTDEEVFNKHIRVNLTAAFLLYKNVFKLLKESSSAVVLFISSLAGVCNKNKFATAGAYTASKMGVVGLCEVIAAEGKEYGIRANCLSPGAVDTEMLRENFPDLEANLSVSDIARYILFYISDSSAPVTGTNTIIQGDL